MLLQPSCTHAGLVRITQLLPHTHSTAQPQHTVNSSLLLLLLLLISIKPATPAAGATGAAMPLVLPTSIAMIFFVILHRLNSTLLHALLRVL
jgi:hypothetical protein